MHRRTATPRDRSVETGLLAAIARQRGVPQFYVVDAELRLLSSSRGLEPSLPDDVRAAADFLLANRETGNALVLPLESGSLVRVVPTVGPQPSYVVFVTPARDPLARAAERYGLSQRELEVVHALLRGESTSHIAAALTISQLTVLQHVKNVGRKIGVSKRKEIVATLTGAR